MFNRFGLLGIDLTGSIPVGPLPGEVEGGALIDGAVGPNSAMVRLDQEFGYVQAQAGA